MHETFLVIVFDSTNRAIHGEQVAKKAGFNVRCIPTPREISSDCGIVLRIKESERKAILQEFRVKKVDYTKLVPL